MYSAVWRVYYFLKRERRINYCGRKKNAQAFGRCVVQGQVRERMIKLTANMESNGQLRGHTILVDDDGLVLFTYMYISGG